MKFIKIQEHYVNLDQVTDIEVNQAIKRLTVYFNNNFDIEFDFENKPEFIEALTCLARCGVPISLNDTPAEKSMNDGQVEISSY